MPDFALFKAVDGEIVAIHVDKVTYVRPRVDGNGTLIAFAGDDGIGVQGTLLEVVDALSNQSPRDGTNVTRAPKKELASN